MAVGQNDAQFLQQLTRIKRTRLQELEKQAALTGIATAPHITLEIESLRAELGAVDMVANGPDDWKPAQVGLIVFLLLTNGDRWSQVERLSQSNGQTLRIAIVLQGVQVVAFIMLMIVMIWRNLL